MKKCLVRESSFVPPKLSAKSPPMVTFNTITIISYRIVYLIKYGQTECCTVKILKGFKAYHIKPPRIQVTTVPTRIDAHTWNEIPPRNLHRTFHQLTDFTSWLKSIVG